MAKRPVLAVLGPLSTIHLTRWIEPFTRDFDVHVLTFHPAQSPPEGITVHALPRPTGTRLDYLLGVRRTEAILHAIGPDLLHAHYLTSYGYVGARVAAGCPRVLSVWGTDMNRFPQASARVRAVVRRFLPVYDVINAPAEHLARKLESLGVARDRIEVFQYGVRTDLLRPRGPHRHEARVRVISMRDWRPWYRIEALIDGVASYLKDADDIELHLFGGGRNADQRRIHQRLARAQRSDRIHLHGRISASGMLEHLGAGDVFVSLPTMDGTPLSLMEALAVGLYPVLSDIDANREWVTPVHGTLLAPVNEGTVRAGLREAVARSRAGHDPAINRGLVVERCDYSTNIRRMDDIYGKLLNRIRASPTATGCKAGH